MFRTIVSAILVPATWAALWTAAAVADPETDPKVVAELAQRFQPFDKVAGSDWEPAFPALYRTAPQGGPEGVPVSLAPGAYIVVVLCNCANMDVTLVGPGGTKIEPIRHNDQAAMYSLDVTVAGDYLTGIDMGDCDHAQCPVAVKVYRKKKT